MRHPDYLPLREAVFYTWVATFFSYLTANLQRFGIAESVIAPLLLLRDDFEAKYVVAIAPETRTKAAIRAKNDAINALKAALRVFVKEYLTYNHRVTDADRSNLGLPVHKKSRTPLPAPTSYPTFMVDSSTIRFLKINFRDAACEGHAKPFGVYGAEIRWGISDTPVINPDHLSHSTFDTRSSIRIEFKGEERGKTVWFCLRWENRRGVKGPWSEIGSAIVP